jgi:hypothetical protein
VIFVPGIMGSNLCTNGKLGKEGSELAPEKRIPC